MNSGSYGLRQALAVCLLLAVLSGGAHAATRTAVMSGVWTNTTIWGGSPAPVAGDAVIIPTGLFVNLPASVTPITLQSLTLGNGAGSGVTGISCDTNQAEISITGSFVASAENVQHGQSPGKSWYGMVLRRLSCYHATIMGSAQLM